MKVESAELIGGRYELISRISAGGMGEIHRARDGLLDRIVALKMLPSHAALDPQFVERFRREAQTAGRLNHPNVVHVYDWGEWSGTYFMAMEYVRGRNLRSILARGPLEATQAAEVMTGVLAGLSSAHDAGLVHRDVKPENILISVRGVVKVADFGIARLASAAATSALLGTVAYVSPEQVRGEPLDRRSDIYSAGCVLFEMLTGSPAFEGDAAQILQAHLEDGLPIPSRQVPGIPEAFDRVVKEATAISPAERYPDAPSMVSALAAAVSPLARASPLAELVADTTGEESEALMTTVRSAPPPRPRWGRRALVALLAISLAALAFVRRPTRVPEVLGLTEAEAGSVLEDAGLGFEVRREFSDDLPGEVASSDPERDSWVLRGWEVVLVVSKGPELVRLRNLVGLPESEAFEALEAAGLVRGDVKRRHSSAAAGVVFDQRPEPGRVRAGEPVNLVVSLGPEMIEVPKVTGMSERSARTTLQGAGLEPVSKRSYSSAPLGEVIAQYPKLGARIEKGAAVTITVSRGPKPFPMPALEGASCTAAVERLRGLGLRPFVRSRSGGCGTRRVLDQDPLAGARVSRGDEAIIYVA